MNAMAHLGGRIRDALRAQPAVNGLPRFARIVRSESPGGGTCDVHAFRVLAIGDGRMQAGPAGARLPVRPWPVASESGQLFPRLASVRRSEQGSIFDAGVDRVRIGQRWFEMPDTFELPGVRCTVVPLMRPWNAVIDEVIAHRLPGFATVIRALDQLPEPAARLRGVQPVWISGGSLQVIHFPAAKVRA